MTQPLPNLGYNDRSRPVEQSDFARSIPIPNVYILGLLVGKRLLLVSLQTASFAIEGNSELFSLTSALQTPCSLGAKPQSVTMHK